MKTARVSKPSSMTMTMKKMMMRKAMSPREIVRAELRSSVKMSSMKRTMTTKQVKLSVKARATSALRSARNKRRIKMPKSHRISNLLQ